SMVTAGFLATVAPLGTALTEDQLALLWKMVDEPFLCFDGDQAGQRAAFRAVDLALPRLKPGKSLLFPSLPDGHAPDDLPRPRGAGRKGRRPARARGCPPARGGAGGARARAGSFRPPGRRPGPGGANPGGDRRDRA